MLVISGFPFEGCFARENGTHVGLDLFELVAMSLKEALEKIGKKVQIWTVLKALIFQ
jgi:hypothetical protein